MVIPGVVSRSSEIRNEEEVKGPRSDIVHKNPTVQYRLLIDGPHILQTSFSLGGLPRALYPLDQER